MRHTNEFWVTTLAAAAVLASAVTRAEVQLKAEELQLKREDFILPAQPLGDSLRAVGNQADVNVLFDPAQVESRLAPAIKVSGTVAEALAQLLIGSGLTPRFLNEHTVVLATSDHDQRTAPFNSSQPPAAQSDAAPQLGQALSADYLRLAQADGTTTVESTSRGSAKAAEQAVQKDSSRLEEVVVTAEKREERLQDVPVPVTVLNGDDLAQNNLTRLQDYFASVPGLSFYAGGPSGQGTTVAIRGLSSSGYPGDQTPTVGFMIDDSIYGSSQKLADAGEATGFPDIDPSDIERIEVLKGPQGTLYGADSIGGVIKIVTKDPSMAGYSAHVQVLGEDMQNGGGGYAVRAAANIPVTDEFAVRASAFYRHDPGYIDNVETGQTNVNWADVYGTHIAALFRPTERFSVKLTALVQNDVSNANSTVNVDGNLTPTLGDLNQTGLPGTGQNRYLTQAYNATIKAEFSGINFVSATGYDLQRDKHLIDLSGAFSSAAFNYFPPATGSEFFSNWTGSKVSEEVRLSSSMGHWADWLVGAFYTHESSSGFSYINANDAVTGAYAGTFYTETSGHLGDPATTLSEEAGFGDLTIHVTNEFDFQIGGRESYSQQSFNHAYFGPATNVYAGALASGDPVFLPTQRSNTHAFTYLVTPEYKFSPDLMVYSRIATGYQIGGANQSFANYQTPLSYVPSKTTNYEIGTKGSLDNGRISFDASAYYINWRNIQVDVSTGAPYYDGYTENAGSAKSEGLELSLKAHPVQSLYVSAVGSYNYAVLTQDLPASAFSYALKGAPLPYSMRWSGSLTADMDVAHLGKSAEFVGTTVSYIGRRYGDFAGGVGQPRLMFPDYTTVNMHAGIRWDKLTVNLFVNNLGNRRGMVAGNNFLAAAGGYYAQIIPPRLIGLSLSSDF